MRILEKLFHPPVKKRFSAWQIELTTRCPLLCTMCVKEGRTDYLQQDMAVEDFERIVPYLAEVENVVLEGWGESLLHPRLPDIIRLAKKAGPRVGFVTSGYGLTEAYAADILEAGIDFIGFSFSGATSGTHNAIRVNSDFDALVRSVGYVQRQGAARGPKGPGIHIVFLMLKGNVSEILPLIDLAVGLGIRDVVLVNAIQITNERQDEEKVFTCGGPSPHEPLMKAAERQARRLGIRLRTAALDPRDTDVCSENPLSNLYVSTAGDVSPCVYLHPPVTAPFRRFFCGRQTETDTVSFGNIFREPPEKIWNGDAYRAFRDIFQQRKDIMEGVYRDLLDLRRPKGTELPEPPLPCRTCHKMLGV